MTRQITDRLFEMVGEYESSLENDGFTNEDFESQEIAETFKSIMRDYKMALNGRAKDISNDESEELESYQELADDLDDVPTDEQLQAIKELKEKIKVIKESGNYEPDDYDEYDEDRDLIEEIIMKSL